jgi:RNA polymerase sigma-70 factor, ECF subfamily
METLDNILVARAQSGSEDAFAELASKHSSLIYKCSLRILQNREDAEDNLQNVLLQTFLNINNFEGKSQFSTWLVRVAINEALMTLRKRKRDKFVPLQDASHLWNPRPSPEIQAIRAEMRGVLIKEILRISSGRRNEILRFTMGEKRNTNAQKSARFRAKHQLRKQLSYLVEKENSIPECAQNGAGGKKKPTCSRFRPQKSKKATPLRCPLHFCRWSKAKSQEQS